MIAVAALVAVFATGTIEVTLAPDQPVPFVYTDDPFIVEFKSDGDATVTGLFEFTDDDGVVTRVEVPATDLRANGTFWFPVKGAPTQKGRYNTHVTLDAGGSAEESDLVFCRIERPTGKLRAPLCVHLEEPTTASLLALPGIPVRNLQLDTSLVNAADAAERAVKTGYSLSMFTRPNGTTSADPAVESTAKSVGDAVTQWIVDSGTDVPAFEATVAAIRGAGCRAPIAVVAKDGATLANYLGNGSARQIAAVSFLFSEDANRAVAALRRAAEEAGYEAFPIRAAGITQHQPEGSSAGAPLVRQVVEALAAGAGHCEVESDALYDGAAFGPAFVELSALVRQLDGASYVGRLRLPGEAGAVVFRKDNRWCIAAWTPGEPVDIAMPLGEASALSLADDCNNPLREPVLEDGSVRIRLEPEPQYLQGESGDVIATAARDTAHLEARSFVSDTVFRDSLPEDVINLVKTVADSETGRTDRLSFFGLLRLIPYLEQQWHDGEMPREVAVPAIASLARLVRTLCVLEQEAGEPFIELLQETLARTGEYQSQYLTGAGGADDGHERADWLSSEISRLMADAKTLAEEGREIEAVGVASLAEWRARSLEFAARAEPEPEATAGGE